MNRLEATKFIRTFLDNNGLGSYDIKLIAEFDNNNLFQFGEDKILRVNTVHWNDVFDDAKIVTFLTNELNGVKSKKFHNIHKIQELCKVCGQVAKESETIPRIESNGLSIIFTQCGHVIFKASQLKSDYTKIIIGGDDKCPHVWGTDRKSKTFCQLCDARKLYDFQLEGARALEKSNGRFGIFDEMGLGKTIQTLAWIKNNPEITIPYIWTTKSGIKFQHAKEILRVLGPEYYPQVLTKGRDKLVPGLKGYLIGYDLYRQLDLTMFENFGIKSIVLDECQAIKNPKSSRTVAVKHVVKQVPCFVPLSGTPWKNRGSELYTVLNMLDPVMFWNEKAFQREWIEYDMDGKECGIKNPEKFREKIAHICIRRERKEVMPELPDVNRLKLYCEVPEHARKVYNQEASKIKDIVDKAAIEGRDTNDFKSQGQIMQSLIIMRQIVGIAKVDTTREFAEEFLENTDRKLAVFVHHKECGRLLMNQLSTYCKENNLGEPLQLTAALDAAERFDVQEKFNNIPEHRILIGSMLAAGEGINLQKNCSDILLHERQWNPANEEQVEARVARIGQLSAIINATYVLGDKTVDTIFDAIVEGKRRSFNNSMNKSGYVYQWNEKSLISELAEAIAKG